MSIPLSSAAVRAAAMIRRCPLRSMLVLFALLVPATAQTASGAGAAVDEAAEAQAAEALAVIDMAVADHKTEPISAAIAKFDALYPRLAPKTLKRLDKSLANMFARLKPREQIDVDTLGAQARNGRFGPDPESDPETELPAVTGGRPEVMECYHVAIGLMFDKPEGPALLLPVLKQAHVKNWPEMQALLLEGLGLREDPALIKDFEGYLRHEAPQVASAAATALGRYREQPQELRRRAVTSLVEAFAQAQKASDKEAAKVGEDDERPAKAYLSNIQVEFCEALTALTRQNFSKPAEWRTWFDAHAKDAAW